MLNYIFFTKNAMTTVKLHNPLNKKMFFFYAVELISASVFTLLQEFSGLMWLAVVVSFLGIMPKYLATQGGLNPKTANLITTTCLILSSLLWAYIIMYSLKSAPVIYSGILVARILATIIAFKEIRDHLIIVVPLLLAFALMKPAGCVPPLAF